MSHRPKNYIIRKNVDVPKSGRSFGQFLPLKEMDVGDSFLFASADEKRVQSIVDTYGKKNGAAFFINISDDGPCCWRTA